MKRHSKPGFCNIFLKRVIIISIIIHSRVFFRTPSHIKTAIGTETYLNECIQKRLILFIDRHHTGDSSLFWPDLASAHYARKVQAFLTDHRIHYVARKRNVPNVRLPHTRPRETIWTLLEKKMMRTIGRLRMLIN